MSKVKAFDKAGKAAGDIDIPDSLLEKKRGGRAVKDVVINSLAMHRAGTASSLRKGEVAGSNKKPWKQKGTGRARAGLRQSPVWRGGGVAFGPHPKVYGGRMNKKVSRLAFRRAFADKVEAGAVVVVESFSFDKPKTKLFEAFRKALGVQGPVLFVAEQKDRNFVLASRNVPGTEIATAKDVSVYQVVRYPRIVLTRSAMDVVKQRLAQGAG